MVELNSTNVICGVQDGQCRTVRQFQFTDWPDQGVPNSGEGFIELIGQVHKTKEQFGHEGPIIVHCRYALHFRKTRHLYMNMKTLQRRTPLSLIWRGCVAQRAGQQLAIHHNNRSKL